MDKPALVLIVDDDLMVIRALSRMLSSAKYDIITAYTLADAIAILRTVRARVRVVILADLTLQDGNGARLAKIAEAINPAFRILFMTGDIPAPEEEHRTFMKPFELLKLRQRILVELAAAGPDSSPPTLP